MSWYSKFAAPQTIGYPPQPVMQSLPDKSTTSPQIADLQNVIMPLEKALTLALQSKNETENEADKKSIELQIKILQSQIQMYKDQLNNTRSL